MWAVYLSRVRGEDAAHVGPDGDPRRPQHATEYGRGEVAAVALEGRRDTVGGRGDVAGDHQVRDRHRRRREVRGPRGARGGRLGREFTVFAVDELAELFFRLLPVHLTAPQKGRVTNSCVCVWIALARGAHVPWCPSCPRSRPARRGR